MRLERETRKQTDELVRQLTLWQELARSASNLGDVIKLGEKIEKDLDVAAEKLEAFREKEIEKLGLFKVIGDQIVQAVRFASFTPGAGSKPFLEGAQDRIAGQESGRQSLIRDTLLWRDAAEQATAAWQSLNLGPLNDAIAKQNTLLVEARAKYAALKTELLGLAAGELDEKKTARAANALKELNETGRNIELLTGRINQLTGTQTKLAAESDKVATSISKIGIGKAEELATELEDIHAKLLKQGVAAASPHEALEKSKTLTGENAEAVVALAGRWAGVLGNIEQMNVQLQTMLDHEAVIRAHAFGSEDEIAKAEWGARYNAILAQRKNLGRDTSADSINQAVYAEVIAKERDNERSAAERSSSVNHELLSMKREESALMKDIRLQQQLIQEDTNLTPDEKLSAMIPLLERERDEILKTIEAWQIYLAAQKGTDPQSLANMQEAVNKLRELQGEYQLLGLKVQGMSRGVTGELKKWADSFGTSSQQIARTIEQNINNAIRSTAQLLTDALFRTGDWKKALIAVGEAGVQSLIEMGLQMLMTHTLGEILKGESTASSMAQGAAIAGAHAPAAAATSISSFGWAAVIGAALAGAAIAFIIGSLTGGFAGGGRIPGRPSRRDNMLIPMATGEHVINAPATEWVDQTFGDNFLLDLNAKRIPLSIGLAAGGRVGGFRASSGSSSSGSSAATEIHIFNFTDERTLRDAIMNSRAGRKIIVDTINGRRVELGI